MICSSRRVAGDRPQQPLAARPSPPRRSRTRSSAEQRDGGVAQPAEAVVPVAYAAELLGQRRGRRGDDAAGRRVGECLESRQRAAYGVLPVAVVAYSRPSSAHQDSVSSSARADVDRCGGGRCDRCQTSDERQRSHRPARSNSARWPCRDRSSVQIGRGSQPARPVRRPRSPVPSSSGAPTARCARSRSGAAARCASAPRREALDEPQHQVARRAVVHEVGDPQQAVVGLEVGLQDQRARPGTARRVPRISPIGAIFQRPFSSSPSRAAKQRAESKRGRQSQSIEPSRPTSAAVCVSPIRA